MPDRDFQSSADSSNNLVFALCHEISNLVAAIRLQAHLLDEELDARGLAVSSLEIDDLSARCAALLALVRPVLNEVAATAVPAPIPANVIAHGFERALEANPEDYEIAFFLGVVLRRTGNDEAAIEAFEGIPPEHKNVIQAHRAHPAGPRARRPGSARDSYR